MAFVNFTFHGKALLIRNMFARILRMPGAAALPRDEDGAPMSTGKVRTRRARRNGSKEPPSSASGPSTADW